MKPLFAPPLLLCLTQCTGFDRMAYHAYPHGNRNEYARNAFEKPQEGSFASYPSRRRNTQVPYPMDGVVTESSTGNRTWRDRSSGTITGSEWTSPAGTTTYRDSSGSILGSSDESPAGTRTYRDRNGSISQTSSTSQGSSGDNTTTFRQDGQVVGTKYVSPAGNTTWRDSNGSIVDGPSGMKP